MLFDLQVNSFAMINECRVGFEGGTTFGTQETLNILVDGDFMDSEGGSSRKTLRAGWTSIRPFSYKSKKKRVLDDLFYVRNDPGGCLILDCSSTIVKWASTFARYSR